MRVALLTYRGNPYSGGQGVYVRYLARGLRDLGHAVTVLSGPPYPDLDDGVDLVRVPGLDVYSTIPPGRDAWRRIRRPVDLWEYGSAMFGIFGEPLAFGVRAMHYLRARAGDFDVVHDNQSLSYPLLQVQRGARMPVVATVHHPINIDRAHALAEASSWSERFQIRRWYSFLRMQGRVARRLSRVITVSESSRRETRRAFALNGGVEVVYNGVDTDRFVAPENIRRDPRRVIVVNSADQPIKGLHHLYGMLEQLAGRADVQVSIVGSPRDRVATTAELRRRGLEERVRFLGKLSHEDLVRAYSSSSVAVIPSLYEGFGLPAVEAMACSVPVVAFEAGALPEVLGPDGTSGRIVPAFDEAAMACAVAELIEDPQRAIELGVAGRQRALREFSWDRAARQTADIYEQVLA